MSVPDGPPSVEDPESTAASKGRTASLSGCAVKATLTSALFIGGGIYLFNH